MNRKGYQYLASLTSMLALMPLLSCLAEESKTVASASSCVVSTSDPHPACSDSAQVIDELEKFMKAFAKGDLDYCASCLDEHCTFIDQSTNKAISGKAALLDHLKQKWQSHSPSSNSPLTAYTISSPYAHVKGDTCVVSFVALKEFKGEYPAKYESHSTEVYVKKDNRWLLTHYRSNWKRVS